MDRLNFRTGMTWGLAAIILTMTGCSFFPESLQPHNLQKLNRQAAPSTDPFFSVPPVRHYTYCPAVDPYAEVDDVAEDSQPEQ